MLSRNLAAPRLERAIGVIYRPDTERGSHYFHASLPRQFDFVLHFDETTALEPLKRTERWQTGEPAETIRSACDRTRSGARVQEGRAQRRVTPRAPSGA